MKHFNLIIISIFTVFIATSCKKQTAVSTDNSSRKVKFILYTDKDFSTDNNTIVFKVSIQKTSNQVLWDSTFAPMKIKDIPNSLHKLVIEKAVPGNDSSDLKVGFYYTITNVGNSWFLDLSPSGETFKEISYNFQ